MKIKTENINKRDRTKKKEKKSEGREDRKRD